MPIPIRTQLLGVACLVGGFSAGLVTGERKARYEDRQALAVQLTDPPLEGDYATPQGTTPSTGTLWGQADGVLMMGRLPNGDAGSLSLTADGYVRARCYPPDAPPPRP
jgi:hypothetical protein